MILTAFVIPFALKFALSEQMSLASADIWRRAISAGR
jgi:hypothetical protein